MRKKEEKSSQISSLKAIDLFDILFYNFDTLEMNNKERKEEK